LKKLGAKHALNYKTDPSWGESSKALTPSGRGVDYVVDVGGDTTLGQSMKALRCDGIVSATGLLGGQGEDRPALLDAMYNLCIVRGVLLGTRSQFMAMNRFIDAHDIKPVLDDEIFSLENVKKSYQKLEGQHHFSKIIIKIRES
jgi:NADPH:quinone reductase-like Zn-dependent oxidoreductase